MKRLPPPTTFAEGMRLLFAIAALFAGVAFGIGLVALVAVFVWGGWPAAYYEKIIGILGWVAIGAITLIGITQIGILLGGPVGRFRVAVDKTGVSGEASSADAQSIAQTAAATGAAVGAAVAAATPAPKPPEPPLPRP